MAVNLGSMVLSFIGETPCGCLEGSRWRSLAVPRDLGSGAHSAMGLRLRHPGVKFWSRLAICLDGGWFDLCLLLGLGSGVGLGLARFRARLGLLCAYFFLI